MNTVTLNNGKSIPQLGIGTYLLSPEQAEKSVSFALAHDYRLIDTANIYMNEKAVGRAIHGSQLNRESIFLTTKMWPSEFRYDKARKAIDTSLKRLQVDYLDLVLLHQPAGDIAGAWKALEEAVADGKIRSIGVSNFNITDVQKLLDSAKIPPAVNQIECHPYAQQSELKAFMRQHGIAIEAWYPLGSANKDLLAEPIFHALAQKYDKSVVQIILRWHVQMGHIVIPGSSNTAHIESNMNIFDFALSEADMANIAQLDKNKPFMRLPRFALYFMKFLRTNFDNQD
ncbi:aldo/keto reductase [Alloscardovia criceti]|uniref:aldo/keto reductase n=1 Tax=Alloscardovia criceti TaxID=356828 RepID=UPI0003767C27|nr:aldo/keto reductase [Alloscardovia criceti]